MQDKEKIIEAVKIIKKYVLKPNDVKSARFMVKATNAGLRIARLRIG